MLNSRSSLLRLFTGVATDMNLVFLLLQCLDNVQKVSLPARTAAVSPGGGSAMETMTVLMDLMRCRNLMSGFPLNNILF